MIHDIFEKYATTKSANIIAIVSVCVLFSVCSSTFANYEITWYSIDAGSQSSAAGPYTLTATAGQPDARVISASRYVLSGGFWPGSFGCVVNLTDLLIFAEYWLETGRWPADIDEDGQVNLADFAELSYWWYDSCPADWPLK